MNEIAAQELLQHTAFVRRVALALCADEHGAEDLVQETWIRAMTRERPDSSRLRAWLAGVARNLAREGRRGATRRSAREEAAARREHQPPTDDLVERMETHRRVVSAVLELPESSRRVIVLRYFDGWPPRRIAARLGVPVETVRTRLKRARERLREELAEEHGSDRACVAALLELARGGATGASISAGAATFLSTAKLAAAAVLVAALGLSAWRLVATEPEQGAGEEVAVVSEPELAPPPADRGRAASTAARSEGGRRPNTPPAAVGAAAAEPSGLLIVREVDGRELEGESGQFFLRPIGGAQAAARHIRFTGGRFSLEGIPAGTVQIERAETISEGEYRPVVLENAQLEHRPGEPLVVSGSFLRDSTLRVVDAGTGLELDGVCVLPRHSYPGQRHPGPHLRASYCVRDRASPVLLPRVRAIRSYWVTAEGYTWSFLKVDDDSGGEREVRLEPAGRLAVQLAGHDPGLAITLRVCPRGEGASIASCKLDEGGFQAFDGIAPGEYDVRAEVGALDDPPRVLAEASAVVAVGGTESVYLESRGELVPPAVAVEGELVLPIGHEELDVTLRILPAGGPRFRPGDRKRISRNIMGLSDSPGVLSWDAGELTPGRYVFLVAPVQHGVLLDVPAAPVDDLRIVVPDLFPVVVRALDAGTGEAVEHAQLRWSRELPREAGTDAWVYFGLEPGRDSATRLVPAGSFFLAASSPVHDQRFLNTQVGAGTGVLTLELPRRIPLEIVLADGETVVPWVHGMTCTYRVVGAQESHPCGSYGEGKMRAYVEGPGLYEIRVGPVDGFRQPEPVVVAVEGKAPPRVVVSLLR